MEEDRDTKEESVDSPGDGAPQEASSDHPAGSGKKSAGHFLDSTDEEDDHPEVLPARKPLPARKNAIEIERKDLHDLLESSDGEDSLMENPFRSHPSPPKNRFENQMVVEKMGPDYNDKEDATSDISSSIGHREMDTGGEEDKKLSAEEKAKLAREDEDLRGVYKVFLDKFKTVPPHYYQQIYPDVHPVTMKKPESSSEDGSDLSGCRTPPPDPGKRDYVVLSRTGCLLRNLNDDDNKSYCPEGYHLFHPQSYCSGDFEDYLLGRPDLAKVLPMKLLKDGFDNKELAEQRKKVKRFAEKYVCQRGCLDPMAGKLCSDRVQVLRNYEFYFQNLLLALGQKSIGFKADMVLKTHRELMYSFGDSFDLHHHKIDHQERRIKRLEKANMDLCKEIRDMLRG